MTTQTRQPYLNELSCSLASLTQVWSATSGDIGGSSATLGSAAQGAQGVLHDDIRVLSCAQLRADGRELEHLATVVDDRTTTFASAYRYADGITGQADELIRLDRIRQVEPGRVSERIEIESMTPHPTQFDLTLRLAYDLAAVEQIKVGLAVDPQEFAGDDPLHWGGDVAATLTLDDTAVVTVSSDRKTLELHWPISLEPRASCVVQWALELRESGGAIIAPSGPGLPIESAVDRLCRGEVGRDPRVRPWLERSLHDLDALRLATRPLPTETFFGAGAPWYLTLFGRDSIWSARLTLPVDAAPAIGTLRTLAHLAGRVTDPDSAQQPGKIMHELRGRTFAYGDLSLPPLYYGTIDATPLWVCLLHDLWRRGGHDDVIIELLDPLVGALDWLLDHGDADGDGFLEYIDRTGHGLTNQGWKDSADSVRYADGSLADGPVALCEVQGYAYEAARGGAELLDAFGRDGAERYRAWADELAVRFREQFWCGEGADRFPALALDGEKRRVDSLTSNIGHLLGTGLLDQQEEILVARRIAGPDLDSGLGLRTMSASDGGYHPLSYHCGSVWPHDTAIVIMGLRRAGLVDHAGGLVEGLLRASVLFDQRLPELWSGEGRAVPYAASCRPQAWSAAAAVVVAEALAR